MENKEVWKQIKGYEGLYEVSNSGVVKALHKERRNGKNGSTIRVYPQKILTQKKSKKGYTLVALSKDGKTKFFTVHRLVAIAFISNNLNKETVNHIDLDKSNNKVSNLEWNTRSENSLHAGRHGRQTAWFTSSNNPNKKK